jgi:SET domain-containing protein
MASKILKSRFYMPDEDKYRFFRIEIKPSTVEGAGRGAFALDPIPKDSAAMYKGIRRSKNSKKLDCYYSWELYEYNKKGHVKNDKIICYIDCSKEETGNWTRFANCGPQEDMNNFTPRQYKNNMYYVANRDIKAGEELFIDYGTGYRQEHLGIEY